ALNLFVCLPMNRLLIQRPAADPVQSASAQPGTPAPANGMVVLAFVFGAVGFVTGAMAAHLPRLLELAGASAAAAIAAAALIGPAGYGRRTGIIVMPARVTAAAAPLLFGLLLDAMGTGALVISAGLGLAALAALALLRVQPAAAGV